MTFTPFKRADTASRITGCRVGLTKYKNSKTARLVVTIAGPMREAMKLGRGRAHFEVAIGEGEHHGLMRIRSVAVGNDGNGGDAVPVEPRQARGGTFYRLDLGYVDLFVNESHKAVPVQWELVEDGWFEFALPEWADKTRPRPKEAVSAVPPAVLKSKAAGDADQARQKAERREADERRNARELFGDKIGDKVAGAARKAG